MFKWGSGPKAHYKHMPSVIRQQHHHHHHFLLLHQLHQLSSPENLSKERKQGWFNFYHQHEPEGVFLWSCKQWSPVHAQINFYSTLKTVMKMYKFSILNCSNKN